MDSTQDDGPVVTGSRRRRTLLQLTVAFVSFVGVACAVFVWWGSPRLSEGSLYGPGAGMSWANDGVEDTRMVVRGESVATISATFGIRNDGRLPVTVHGLDSADMIPWFSQQRVMFVPGILGFGEAVPPSGQVTLDPGEEATVLWSLDMACRTSMSEGSHMDIDALRFKVTWLGGSTTRELPLERPITFVGDGKPRPFEIPGCTSD